MMNQRIALLVVVILASPLTAFVPFANSLSSPNSTTFITSSETAQTYTSASMQTYFGSTSGITTTEAPMNFPMKGIGFAAPKGKCAEYSLPVTVTSGTRLNIRMTATQPVNFYLLTTYAFPTSPNGCDILSDAIMTAENFTKFTLLWTAPAAGTFYLAFTGPSAIIILADGGSMKPVTQKATITYATSTETSLSLISSTSMTRYTATSTLVPSFSLQPTAPYSLPLVAIIVMLLLGLVVLAYFKRR